MSDRLTTPMPSAEEIAELRDRLAEAEETLRAIRSGEVEALVVEGPDGPQVFSLTTADSASNRFRGEIIAQVSEAVVATDEDERVTFLNAAAERQYGVRAADVLGQKLSEIYAAEWASDDLAAVAAATLRARGEWRGELIHRVRDGRKLHVESSVTMLRGEDGTRGTIAAIRDMSERQETSERLRERQHFLQRVIDVTPGLVHVFDLEQQRTVFINRTVASELGYSPADVEAMGAEVVPTLVHPDDLPRFDEHMRRVRALGDDETADLEHRMRDAAGRWHWFHSRDAVFTRDADGRVRQIIGTSVQVTARKEAEEAMRSADRMDAVGRLSGGVAHEANNQMTVVLGCASFALRRDDLSPDIREELVHIREAAQRTAAITGQLLAFSRRQILRPGPLDLNMTIEAFVPILRRTLGEASELVTELSPSLEPVLTDRGQIEQVLVNLAFNARDAMAGGGRVTLTTRAAVLAEPEPGSDPTEPLQPGRYGVLTVRDTGCGMSPETLSRIFEPFFTTKPFGEGTGLGLSTVYGIVRQLGGDVLVKSRLGEGTAVGIYLPIAELEVSNGQPVPQPSAAPAKGCVLVVEDEASLRHLTMRVLEAEGFEVLGAEDGRAALAGIAGYPGTVDLVLSDVAMPVMGGRELAEHMAHSHPAIPVLFMSGHATHDLIRRGMLSDETVPLLLKPFSPEELVRRVRALVCRRGR